MAEENERELTLTRIYDAPRELVWRFWTDPELLARWWGPHGVTNPESEVDLRPGGVIRIVMLAGEEMGPLAGQRWPMQGMFKEIVEPEKLVFANQAVDEAGNVLIDGMTTVTFEEQDGKTRLTMQTRAKAVTPEAVPMIEGMTAGWTQSLDKLTEAIKQ
ncbi:MAG TPA: SRPBCC domain-containing protein [Verrucomicrobiae bacterium]|nr:SRPBCC domain-containing protein [Verrucomicrobiae bacterium]